MAPRTTASTTRLAILTLLIGLATVSLAPRTPRPPAQPLSGLNPWLSLTIIAALVIPALILIIIAARFRPRPAPRAPVDTTQRGKAWLGVLVMFGILAIAVGAMVLGRSPWLLLVLLVLAAAALLYRKRIPRPRPENEAEERLAAAVERALRIVVEPGRDPRTAIIRCYAAMEDALTTIPGAVPLPADSPSEVLDRARSTGAIRTSAARRLVNLFGEARFSTHAMTEPDRTMAERSLRLILAELGEPT